MPGKQRVIPIAAVFDEGWARICRHRVIRNGSYARPKSSWVLT